MLILYLTVLLNSLVLVFVEHSGFSVNVIMSPTNEAGLFLPQDQLPPSGVLQFPASPPEEALALSLAPTGRSCALALGGGEEAGCPPTPYLPMDHRGAGNRGTGLTGMQDWVCDSLRSRSGTSCQDGGTGRHGSPLYTTT